jgi:hypothetical protein
MLPATLIALLLGASLWFVAVTRSRSQNGVLPSYRKYLEYWWVVVAFTSGAIGVTVTFMYPFTPGQATTLRVGPLAVIGLMMVVNSIARGGRIRLGSWFLLVLLAIYVAFGLGTNTIAMPATSVLVLLPGIITPAKGYSFEAIKAGLAHSIKLSMAALVVLAFLAPSDLIGTCLLHKCSLWGQSVGAYGTGNALGLFLAAAGCLSLLAINSWMRFVAGAIGSFILVDLTASRSALIAWIVGVAFVIIYKVAQRYARSWPVLLGVLFIVATIIFVALWPWAANSFTGRSQLWVRALELLEEHPFLGYGTSYWVNQSLTSDLDANYATHNLFTEMLVSGGVIGAMLCFLAIAGLIVVQRHSSIQGYVLAVIGIWLSGSITEVVSAPGRIYLAPSILAFVFIVSHSVRTLTPTSGPESNPPQRQKEDYNLVGAHDELAS